ncbi:FdhE protein [Nonomuraea thailandensis]|uniref:FdhE protein n=1 Tax=Nonomuraea thailandensis TaxID=1188745 RepID=A0A9X2GRI3_9ACTN|nr:formate dehydrogenase accessory protein FdhE [Nonomuraea thailandensis]MCP2360391.1 FdhE protein [Nonomuraea thailandensis]
MYGQERARALELRERYPHAGEVLGLYLALVGVWESACGCARLKQAAAEVLPRVVAATVAHGPPALAKAVGGAVGGAGSGAGGGDGAALLAAWVADEELTPVERYLARATMRVVPFEGRPEGAPGRCPACGGPPQLSYRVASEDPLVSGRRVLACAKCPHEWSFSATTCPNCGESGRRTVHAEGAGGAPGDRAAPSVGRREAEAEALFPQLRAETCESCHRYLIDVDLGREPRAVPRVDELAAVPIDLHMAEQGHTKITPNLMGF